MHSPTQVLGKSLQELPGKQSSTVGRYCSSVALVKVSYDVMFVLACDVPVCFYGCGSGGCVSMGAVVVGVFLGVQK